MTIKNTALKTTVGLGSLALVAYSGKVLKDNLKFKPSNKNIQNQGKNLIKGSVGIITGVGLLDSTTKLIGGLDDA
jgi:hypothetical protein